jgi:hypothetical protein
VTVINHAASATQSYDRPFLVGFLVHLVIGYGLYVVALAQMEPPAWAIKYIELLKPTVKCMGRASKFAMRDP